MKKLQNISRIVLAVAIIGFVLGRFVVPFPDWTVRLLGVLLLVSVFTTVFCTAKIATSKK